MKKSKFITTSLICIVFSSVLTFVITYKFYDEIKMYKDTIIEKNKLNFLHENIHDIEKLKSLDDEDNAWYTKYHFLSHSGGE